MAIAVNHIVFRYGVVVLRHECYFHLVLDFLHADAAVNAKAREQSGKGFFCGKRAGCDECFRDCILDFVDRERLLLPVSLDDVSVHDLTI